MTTKPNKKSGMTLVEVLLAGFIGFLTLAVAGSMLLEASRAALDVDANSELNHKIRTFTTEIARDTREANRFVLYDSFFGMDFDLPGSFRQPADGQVPQNYEAAPNDAANLFVLVFNGTDTNPNDNLPPPVERVVGYYLDDRNATELLLRKFDVDVPTARQFDRVADLVPAELASDSHEVIIRDVRGLAENSLFANINDRSVVVNAQVRSDSSKGTKRELSSGTYNFTISPRG